MPPAKKKASRAGIPLRKPGQLKTNTILIKVTAAERQTFQLAAEHAGDNVANWMRRTCRERASHELANKGIKAPIDEVNGTDSTGSRTT